MDKNWRTEYERILSAATEIALATSVGGVPNVRIVNFCQDPKCPGAIYFSTDRSNDKVAEFASNDRIAFTTIPRDGTAHVRTRDATVRRSGRSIGDMKALFLKQVPGFEKGNRVGPKKTPSKLRGFQVSSSSYTFSYPLYLAAPLWSVASSLCTRLGLLACSTLAPAPTFL